MRSTDLDQYWPMPRPSVPPQPSGAVEAERHEQADDTDDLSALAEGFETVAGEFQAGIAKDSDTFIASDSYVPEPDPSAYDEFVRAEGSEPSLDDAQPQDEGFDPQPPSDSAAFVEQPPHAVDPPAADMAPPPPAQSVAPAVGLEASAPSKVARRSHGPLVWGGLGFAAGMIAWHVIGFWIFVSDVVLKGGEGNLKAEESLPGLASTSSGKIIVRAPPKAKQDDAATRCVELAIDRRNGETRSLPCSSGEQVMRDAGFSRHRDRAFLQPRLQDATAWSNTTAVSADAAGAAGSNDPAGIDVGDLETGSLQPSDMGIVIQP